MGSLIFMTEIPETIIRATTKKAAVAPFWERGVGVARITKERPIQG